MNFFGLNSPEIFIILTIILIFLGPKKIEFGWEKFIQLLKYLLSDEKYNSDSENNKFKDNSINKSSLKPAIKTEVKAVKEEPPAIKTEVKAVKEEPPAIKAKVKAVKKDSPAIKSEAKSVKEEPGEPLKKGKDITLKKNITKKNKAK